MSYRMQYGPDVVIVELGMPEQPILVDGENIGRQNADCSCRVDAGMRIAARHCWGDVYETIDDALAAGRDPAAVCIWADVTYVRL